eukprot:1666973-Rhodomonas_salina.2
MDADLVRRQLEQLRVCVGVGDRLEVAVVELEPLLRPRGAALPADALLAVGAHRLATVGKLGLLRPEP